MRPVLASKLLGEDLIGWGSHYFCKLPHDGRAVAWHQDASYWPLTASKTVTVWLAIDDADQANVRMRVLAGSHRSDIWIIAPARRWKTMCSTRPSTRSSGFANRSTCGRAEDFPVYS